MGKGDIKTKKGKIINGTYGVRRPRKSIPAFVPSGKAKSVKKAASTQSKAKEPTLNKVEGSALSKVEGKPKAKPAPKKPESKPKAAPKKPKAAATKAKATKSKTEKK